MPTLTERLCARMCELGSGSVGEAVREHACRLVLDGLAVAVAGTVQERAPGILAGLVREEAAAGVATVIGFGFRTSPVRAAYVNGSAMHVLDYEPMWLPANHALSTTLPAVLALAEARGADGQAVVLALVKGIEIQGWIREASGQWDPGQLTFHPPGLVGPLSAAVAAATLLDLEPGPLAHALGIAASRAGSVLANAGTMTKSTHCGLAASLGLEAALLAARGFDAHPAIFDDPRGYPAAFFPRFDGERLLRFGPPYRVVDPGYAIKMFPSQFGTHYAIAAGLDLHAQIRAAGEDPAAIVEARLVTPLMPYVDRPFPASGLAGKFSFQYAFAAAVLDGTVSMRSFEDERRFRSDMEGLLGRIRLHTDPEISGRFDEMHVEAEIALAGGQRLRARCDGPPGSWRGTPLDPGAHLAKVRECLGTVLPAESAEAVIERARRVDTLDPAGLRELMRLVRADR